MIKAFDSLELISYLFLIFIEVAYPLSYLGLKKSSSSELHPPLHHKNLASPLSSGFTGYSVQIQWNCSSLASLGELVTWYSPVWTQQLAWHSYAPHSCQLHVFSKSPKGPGSCYQAYHSCLVSHSTPTPKTQVLHISCTVAVSQQCGCCHCSVCSPPEMCPRLPYLERTHCCRTLSKEPLSV